MAEGGGDASAAAIRQVLTTTSFASRGAATFTFNDTSEGLRTFLALNDSTAGFSAASDAVIEITGYSGSLTSLAVI